MVAFVPITEARLCGLFAGSVVFGIHLVSFGYCLYCLLSDPETGSLKRASQINWSMLVISSTLWVIAALDVGLGLYTNLAAFVFFTGPGGPMEVFSDISNWVNVMKTATIMTQTIIGDGMLIYRCWIIYSRNWRVVVASILLWIGCVSITGKMLDLEATLHSHLLVNAAIIRPYASSFWALTVVINILTTSLIVWRLWSVDNAKVRIGGENTLTSVHGRRPSYLRRVIRNIIESGLLYTVFALMTFAIYISKSNSIYIMSNMEIQVVGISFDMIIIRTAKFRAEEHGPSTAYPLSHPIAFAHQQQQQQGRQQLTTTTFSGVGSRISSVESRDVPSHKGELDIDHHEHFELQTNLTKGEDGTR